MTPFRSAAPKRSSGFFAVVLLMLVAVVAILALALSVQVADNSRASGSHAGSVGALVAAESGIEYEQRRWAQNVDWYRSTIDPTPSTPVAQTVGSGTFKSYANLPATLLKAAASSSAAAITVYATDRYPSSGILQLGDDVTSTGEFVRYTGISGNTFTGLTRAQTVGTVTSVAGTFSRSDTVYPVTVLRTSLAANCTALASINVDANTKLLSAGTLDIEGEEISYNSSSTSGATMTLYGITRCLGATTNVSHAVGQPVTPVLIGGDSADHQVEVFATGTLGTHNRYARKTIQR